MPEKSYVITAAHRALMVMEVLAQESELGVTEVASRLGITKSLAFRLLQTLEAAGYAIRRPDRKTYSLGYRVLHLGAALGQRDGLVQATQGLMDALAAESAENVNLVVRDGTASIVVATRESPHQVRLFAEAGRRGPLHAGGASMVLLAHAPDEVVDAVLASPLHPFTPATATEPAAVRATLARIRADGLHVSMNDLDQGAFSIAAPIRDASGRVVAAVSVAGPVSRLDATATARFRDLVPAYANRMSEALGRRSALAA